MKKTLLMAILSLFFSTVAISAGPGWVLFGQLDTGEKKYFQNQPDSGRNTGSFLHDNFKDVAYSDTEVAHSYIETLRANCNDGSFRSLRSVFYSGYDGRGNVVESSATGKLIYPLPGTVGFSYLNALCGRL